MARKRARLTELYEVQQEAERAAESAAFFAAHPDAFRDPPLGLRNVTPSFTSLARLWAGPSSSRRTGSSALDPPRPLPRSLWVSRAGTMPRRPYPFGPSSMPAAKRARVADAAAAGAAAAMALPPRPMSAPIRFGRFRYPGNQYPASLRRGYVRPVVPLATQVRRLLAGKRRDAATVTQYNAAAITSTTVGCITSSTAVGTAISTTGLISADADQATLNSLTLRGYITVAATADQTFGAVRLLLVSYIKPATLASSAGTLPLVTDCLESDSVYSLPLSDTANSGRFRILWDQTINVGRNGYASAPGADTSIAGPQLINIDQYIPLNIVQHYVSTATSSAGQLGGHYDSDSAFGQVDRNLVCLYVLTSGSVNMGMTLYRRLNYTA